ncbi:MAG TPA: uroporphyrinogen decarboxylase family protein [Armatimonadota bacterium]|nr:uroporphyrinogen decarboxylase family protein [Armatimonadota bacterium]HPT97675.1 uroporphyrinogen decarboxylase family protein [Armatimonadota bacterium]
MTSTERVLAAIAYQPPDRIPLFDSFWAEFVQRWRQEKGLDASADIEAYYGIDIAICVPDETPWPSQAAELERSETGVVTRDGWGAIHRTRSGAHFYQEAGVALADKRDPERLEFEAPEADARYAGFLRSLAHARAAGRCPFAKTGGPYLRTMNLRGHEQWLVDIAEDPDYAAALAGRVTDHITAVGVEAIRRGNLQETGIWIYDDIASNLGPMVSPRTYERIFLPLMARMVAAYRAAGARYIVMHSDGNILPVLDMLVDAGIDAINPVEPKAGMDIVALRDRYAGRLAFIGGLDNAGILPSGNRELIREHVTRCIRAARDGGIVLGSHSIGPDIAVADYDYVVELIRSPSGT